MAKLIDDILFSGFEIVPLGSVRERMVGAIDKNGNILLDKLQADELMQGWEGETLKITDKLRQTVVILANNVCEYVYMHTGKAHWKVTEDFPCLTPPFKNFWIEMHRPSGFSAKNSQGKTETVRADDFVLKRWAFHFTAGTRDSFEDVVLDNAKKEFLQTFGPIWEKVHSVMRIDSYWESTRNGITGPLNPSYIATDCNGIGLTEPMIVRNSDATIDDDYSNWHLPPALLAISFMHCKNVVATENKPDAKLQKARQKRGQKPLLRYRTLNIEPMAKILKRDGKSDETGLKKALHICRGHFSTYTTERPLFGKVSGTFWVPSHIRGSKSEGEIIKDYSVDVPKTA